MNVLITGITGMIGSGFATETLKRGWNTYGVARSSAASRLAAVDQENVFRCDIYGLDRAVRGHEQEHVLAHLPLREYGSARVVARLIRRRRVP